MQCNVLINEELFRGLYDNVLREANAEEKFLRLGDEIGEQIERHVQRGAHHRR